MVKDTWGKIKNELKEQLPAHTISTWFEPVCPGGVTRSIPKDLFGMDR